MTDFLYLRPDIHNYPLLLYVIQVAENNPSFFNDTYRHKNKTGAKAPVFCLRINQILKEEPQPQVVLAFGLVTINREPSSPSV